MEILKHRINSFDKIDNNFSLELDVRDQNGDLVVSHDLPITSTIKLEDFLQKIDKNKLIAINVKSVEIEKNLKKILSDANLKNYFTFDWPVPSLLKALKHNLICAFRLSEYEKDIIPNCDWVLIDSFQSIWYDANFLNSLKNSGLKLAIVSPELHNRKSDLAQVKDIVNSVKVDAICTDLPDFWYT